MLEDAMIRAETNEDTATTAGKPDPADSPNSGSTPTPEAELGQRTRGTHDGPVLFRREALEHHRRGIDQEGRVLRLSRRWIHWSSRLLRRLGAGDARRRVPYIQQTSAADCGAACLAMVLAYYGKQVRLDEIRDLIGTGGRGTSALRLLESGRWHGLRGRGVKVENTSDLEYLECGAILHWELRHFVVFEEFTSRGAHIVDPAFGRRHVTHEELKHSLTGVALSFQPTEDFEPVGKRSHGMGRYLREISAHSGLVGRLLVSSVVLQLLALALPILTGLLVDRVVPRGDYQLLSILSAGLAAIVIFNFLISLIRARLMLYLRTQLDAKITLKFLEHLINLPYAFFQQRSAGDLMMRLNSNAHIREILTSSTLSGLLDSSLVSLYLILLFFTHVPMSLLVLGLGLLRVVLFLLIRRRQRELMSESLQAQARSRSYQIEMLAGIETLKAQGAERRAVSHWSNLFVDELNVTLARGRLDAIFNSLLGALDTGSPLIILTFGGLQVLQGDLSLGTMLALSALATGLLAPLSALVSTGVQLQLLGSYLERINDVLETPREQQPEEVTPAPQLTGRITLEAVSFRYSPLLPPAIDDVSIDITPGSFVALVGVSGAGKSTLARLLLGLYQPSAGRILYDGIDLATLDLPSVRGQLGIVPQQPYLFAGTVRQNIAQAAPHLPLERLVEAARLAHLHDEILAMPMGYETVLADGGSSLSGRAAPASSTGSGSGAAARDPTSRRGDQQPRRGDRAQDPARARTPALHPNRDRSSLEHHLVRRADRGHGPGPNRGNRPAWRVVEAGWQVRGIGGGSARGRDVRRTS